MPVLADYAAAVARAGSDRRSIVPLAAFLFGSAGALKLWRLATSPPSHKDAPRIKRKHHAEGGDAHAHGSHCHSHGSGECIHDDEAEAAFRALLRSLWSAMCRNQSNLGVLVASHMASIVIRTWATVRLAQATGVLAGHFASLRWPLFFRSHLTLGLFALPLSVLNATGDLLEKQVVLAVRTILFDRLNSKYTEAKLARFYRLALPDATSEEGLTQAPQTLTTELALLSDELVHHVGHLISPTINVVYLSFILAKGLGTAPLLCYLGYFCVSTALIERVKRGSAQACGGTLASAIAEGQQLECELREKCRFADNLFLASLPSALNVITRALC